MNSNSQLDTSLTIYPKNRKCFYFPESLANKRKEGVRVCLTWEGFLSSSLRGSLSLQRCGSPLFSHTGKRADFHRLTHGDDGRSNTHLLQSCVRGRFLDGVRNTISIWFFVHTKVWISGPWVILNGSCLNGDKIFRTFKKYIGSRFFFNVVILVYYHAFCWVRKTLDRVQCIDMIKPRHRKTVTLRVHKPSTSVPIWETFGEIVTSEKSSHSFVSNERRIMQSTDYPSPFHD